MPFESPSHLEHRERLLVVDIVNTTGDVAEFFGVADPILHVEWGDEGTPVEYTPEYIVNHPEETQIFVVRHPETHEIIGGAKIKILSPQDVDRLQLSDAIKIKKGALLEYTFVVEAERERGVLQTLMQQRIEWAKQQGVEYMCTELSIEDPRAIWIKLRKGDGFVLGGVCPPGYGLETPYFVGIRPVDSSSPSGWKSLGLSVPSEYMPQDIDYEWEDVPLDASVSEMQTKMAEGWYGVDLRGTIEQGTKDSVPWSIVFERKK